MRFLLEAGPLLAFLLAYAYAGIYAATAVMVALSALALVAGRWIEGRYSGLSVFTLIVSSLLGGLTLWLRDPSFIQYKPTVVFGAFALALGASHYVGDRVALQSLFGKVLPLPELYWRRVNALWAIYFGIHALLNLYVAYHYSLQTWVYFKVFGFGATTVLFSLLHLPFLWPQLRAAASRKP
ncbi:MAG: septation protein [Hydrocarboniphaga sp.]|uniref:septation protein IspZ n=1 Tax=Hydrocarboniphaga sp. TaxID=2033016 RepID=UPI00260ECB49|nr:septation protein IspZ [Hydrocarboniphaga sp.]MDB5968792.1 septation protein [Hydrocarboniphaga sp.]